MLSAVQGGGLAVGGLCPRDGAHQQTDWRNQSFSDQRGEPALCEKVCVCNCSEPCSGPSANPCLMWLSWSIRCSILNCEVVLDLLLSKLQGSSDTVKMVTTLTLNTKSPFVLPMTGLIVLKIIWTFTAGAVCCVVPPHLWPALSGTNPRSYATKAPHT